MEDLKKTFDAAVDQAINDSHSRCVVSDAMRRQFLSDLINHSGSILSQWPDPENYTFEQAALFFCVRFNEYIGKRFGFAVIRHTQKVSDAEHLSSRLKHLYQHGKCEEIDFGDAKHLLELDVLSLYLRLENEEMFKLTHTLEVEDRFSSSFFKDNRSK